MISGAPLLFAELLELLALLEEPPALPPELLLDELDDPQAASASAQSSMAPGTKIRSFTIHPLLGGPVPTYP
jgi:hypothetical protein